MLELILKGRPRFYLWLCFLGAIFGLGFIVYRRTSALPSPA